MTKRAIDIQFKVDLDKETVDTLVEVLKCKSTELPQVLSMYGKAALLEYIEMFCGNMSLRMAVDTREQRLLQIILAAYECDIPNATDVARLFHLTRTQAQSLLRAVLEKKAAEVRKHVQEACTAVIRDIDPNSIGPIELLIKNKSVYEALNQILADDGRVLPLKKIGTSKYSLDKTSLAVLREYLKLDRS